MELICVVQEEWGFVIFGMALGIYQVRNDYIYKPFKMLCYES